MTELFLTNHYDHGATPRTQDIPVRKLTAEQLAKCVGELRARFDESQAEFGELLNRQFTLMRYIAAVEFEQERRASIGNNA